MAGMHARLSRVGRAQEEKQDTMVSVYASRKTQGMVKFSIIMCGSRHGLTEVWHTVVGWPDT